MHLVSLSMVELLTLPLLVYLVLIVLPLVIASLDALHVISGIVGSLYGLPLLSVSNLFGADLGYMQGIVGNNMISDFVLTCISGMCSVEDLPVIEPTCNVSNDLNGVAGISVEGMNTEEQT